MEGHLVKPVPNILSTEKHSVMPRLKQYGVVSGHSFKRKKRRIQAGFVSSCRMYRLREALPYKAVEVQELLKTGFEHAQQDLRKSKK